MSFTSRIDETLKIKSETSDFNSRLALTQSVPQPRRLNDDEFSEYLEEKNRQRKLAQLQAERNPTRMPTFYEMRKINAGEKVDLSTKKYPKITRVGEVASLYNRQVPVSPAWRDIFANVNLNEFDQKIAKQILEMNQTDRVQAVLDFTKAFLVGGQLSKDQRLIDPENPPAITGGVIGFLYGTILTSDEKEKAERYEKLLNKGVDPKRAYAIAESWVDGTVSETSISEDERKAMRNYSIAKGAFIALEIADLLFIGKPINTALKGLKRGSQLELMTALAKTNNMREARDILKTLHPELAGTEGADELIMLARNASKYDSWRKTLADTKTGREILNRTRGTDAVKADTIAQRIVYEQGIPILKNADNATFKETLRFRQIQRDILSGGATKADGSAGFWTPSRIEANRLSSESIWASERKAGTVSFKQTPNEKINVFIPDTGFTGSQLRPGARVALTEEAVKEGLKASRVKVLQALPDDLVRLPDGTFIYAPREIIGKNITPTLQGIRAEKAQRVADAERKLQERKLKDAQIKRQQQEQRQRLIEEVAEKAREKAIREKAIMDERRRIAIAKANKVIESNRELRELNKAEVRQATAKKLEPLQKERARLNQQLRTLSSKVTKATNKAKTFAEKLTDKKNAIVSKYEAQIAQAEDANKKALLKKEMEAELNALQTKQAEIVAKKDELTSQLEKLKKEIKSKDLDTKIEAIKIEGKLQILEIQKQSVKELREAKRTLRELKRENSITSKDSTIKLKQDSLVTEITSNLKNNFSNFTEGNNKASFGDGFKGTGNEFAPIKVDSEEAKTQVIKSFSDEIDRLRKQLGGEDDIMARDTVIHNIATDKQMQEKAFEMVAKDPAKTFADFVAGKISDETTRGAVALMLMKSDFVTKSMTRLTLLERAFVKFNTRLGQELRAIQSLNSVGYIPEVTKLLKRSEEIMAKRGIVIEEEVKKMLDELGDVFTKARTMSKEDALKAINDNICKV